MTRTGSRRTCTSRCIRTAAPPCRRIPYLQSAQHLLFFAKVGTPFTLALTGTVVSATDTTLTLQVSLLQGFPMNVKLKNLTTPLTLTVPATAVDPAEERRDAATAQRLRG